ncbi:MAG: hypothetical protein HCA25_19545 [Dolichospermum sp. DET50]|nr:hypothetical protein [Dolichospermum sp. DET66]MBS3034392.1 hypothetical protein [Dolichospermum sp. DET67]MBS3039595.1 hypothetical protein [Dolichospermum sp. DET50]QSX66805.1 MAG: hypothetical protein EZY12_18815 [Dolichospermum sp. DET69]
MKVMIFDIESGHFLAQFPNGKCRCIKFKKFAKKFDFKKASTWIRLLNRNCLRERYTLLGDS